MGDLLHISGLSVVPRPNQFDEAANAIEEMTGAEVFARDPEANRLVVVQDLPNIEAHMEGLRRIQALPQVVVAELVYHHSEADEKTKDSSHFEGEGAGDE